VDGGALCGFWSAPHSAAYNPKGQGKHQESTELKLRKLQHVKDRNPAQYQNKDHKLSSK